MHSYATETGLSDHHCMITTLMKSHVVRLKPRVIKYRSYKNFDEKRFLAEVQKADFSCDSNDPNEQFDTLLQKFQSLIDIHAPIKQKTVRGNDAPFMNRDLRKAIYTRTRFKNKYNKNPNVENETKYKKQRKKAIKKHLKEVTSNGIMENKSFGIQLSLSLQTKVLFQITQ